MGEIQETKTVKEWPKVVWMPAGLDGCALWRMFMPHLNYPRSQFLFALGEINYAEFAGDVVCVQRQVGERNLAALRGLRQRGYKIIYDLDDNVWSLPQGNPMAKVFKNLKAEWEPCVKECHVITVSTRGLESAVKQQLGHLGKPVIVCQNAVDMRLYRDCTVAKEDPFTVVGWAGTNTHWHDVVEAWGILPEVLAEFQLSKMEFVGMPPPKEIVFHPRVRMRNWSAVGEFPGRFASWGWDIALAPLEDHRFNISKSPIKIIEAAVMKVPTLCSDVGPYHDFCALGGPDLKWLLCSFKSQWKEKLRRLIAEPDWRRHLGQLAYDVTERFFHIRLVAASWKRAAQIAMEQV